MGKCAALFFGFAASAAAQATFEVASVKASVAPPVSGRNVGCRGGPGTSDPGLFTCTYTTLANLIERAYGIKHYQLSAPDSITWLYEQYDVMARVPEGTTKEQLGLMERALLAERFKLKLHQEPREMPVFELSIGKNGAKLKEARQETDVDSAAAARKGGVDREGFPVMPPGWSGMIVMRDRKMWGAPHGTMADLVGMLSVQSGRPVLDATGLTGTYDMTLRWMLDEAQDAGPTLIDVVSRLLGLKLEGKRAAVDVMVIDHLEKTPTEN